MLIKNDKKYSYGYFSKAGQKSIEENVLLLRHEKKKNSRRSHSSSTSYLFNKEKINLEAQYKNYNFDIFTIEEPDKENLDDIAKEIIKEKIEKIIKRKSETKYKGKEKDKKDIDNKPNININKSFNLKSKYYFHNKHVKKFKKKFLVPPCTKYNPKYDSILRRSVSTPLWKSVTGRKEKKKDIYDFPFYLDHELIQDNMAGKIFIDFSKQTLRKCFLENSKENNLNNSITMNKRPNTCRNKIKYNFNKILHKNYTNKSIKSNINDTNISNDSYEIFKGVYTKQIIKDKNEHRSKKEKKEEENKKKIKSINFNQIISREALDELENNKIAVVPYLFPNYKSIRERPVMMVVYDRKKHKINKNKSQNFKFDNFFLQSKSNSNIHTPNFDLMTSRPYDERDPLPTYMKKIFDRNSYNKITGLSLKLNNYSNRDFIMGKSSFWPKKSFNKFINLNFLKSKKNIYEILIKNKNNDKGQLLEKSLNFYSKNYNDIIKKDNIYKINNLINKSDEKNISEPIKQLINEIKNCS